MAICYAGDGNRAGRRGDRLRRHPPSPPTNARRSCRTGRGRRTMPPDPSNRVSGMPAAIALGRQLFFDTRLSSDQTRSCATCHDPAKSFADGRDRSQGHERLDRNAIALANLRLNRWYGWSGAADSLWAQSLRPILDAREFGMTAPMLRDRLASDAEITRTYRELFSAQLADDDPERMLVNLAKALAAFQETIVTQRTPFDDFRDALERDDTAGMARYPPAGAARLEDLRRQGPLHGLPLRPQLQQRRVRRRRRALFRRARPRRYADATAASRRCATTRSTCSGPTTTAPTPPTPATSRRSIATGASSASPRCATSPAPRPTCTTAASRRWPMSSATTPRSTASACTATTAPASSAPAPGAARRTTPRWTASACTATTAPHHPRLRLTRGARRPRRLPRNPVERVTHPSSRKPRRSRDYPGSQVGTQRPGSRIAM